MTFWEEHPHAWDCPVRMDADPRLCTCPPPTEHRYDPEPIHSWFGLTYSAYLVIQRTALQTMPVDWQRRFVALLDEMSEVIDTDKLPSKFHVRAVGPDGKFVSDPFRDYQRGRARAPLLPPKAALPTWIVYNEDPEHAHVVDPSKSLGTLCGRPYQQCVAGPYTDGIVPAEYKPCRPCRELL